MKPKLYCPASVLLPKSLIEKDQRIKNLLLEYLQDVFYIADAKKMMIRKGNSNENIRYPTTEEKIHILLSDNIPIYYDALPINNKLLMIGPNLPGMENIIGKPQLTLHSGKNSIRLDYFQQVFVPRLSKSEKTIYGNSQNYLVTDELPKEFLAKSKISKLELEIKFASFGSKMKIQKNPFNKESRKLSLVTKQKNQPEEYLTNWCNHYITTHGVDKIIIYNNSPITAKDLHDLPLIKDVNFYYIQWDFSFQLPFVGCEPTYLIHANWLLRESTSYILNFDPDEYLVNDSKLTLSDYIKHTQGMHIDGYEIPPSTRPNKHNSSITKHGRHQGTNRKYIFAPNKWHALFVHSARRYSFIIKPAYWALIDSNSRLSFRFILSKYLYPLLFHLSKFISPLLRMKKAPKKDLYYLHYRALNTHWMRSKEYFEKNST